MDGGDDWRHGLLVESRNRIVNKIMDTLKSQLPFSCQEGLVELKKIAVRYEESVYMVASSQSDYLRKISLKMLTMGYKIQPGKIPPNQGASQSTASDEHQQGKSKKHAREKSPIASNDSSEPSNVNGDACKALAATIQAFNDEVNIKFATLHSSVARLQKDVDSLRARLPGRGDDSL